MTTTSGFPSRLKSATERPLGAELPTPTPTGTAGPGVMPPPASLRNTVTAPLLALVPVRTTRSGFPSTVKSATADARRMGVPPIGIAGPAGTSPPAPSPSQIRAVLSELLTTTTSDFPSRLKSPATGQPRGAGEEGTPKNPGALHAVKEAGTDCASVSDALPEEPLSPA